MKGVAPAVGLFFHDFDNGPAARRLKPFAPINISAARLIIVAVPAPHVPQAVAPGVAASLQSAVPLPFASTSATPQPHTPGAVFVGSLGQPSQASPTSSPSVSA